MASSRSHGSAHSHEPWLGRLLDLDAEIHRGMLEEATGLAAEFVGGPGFVRRVVDIGAGTGTGSAALAGRFPSAEVVAVDVNKEMLARVRDRARSLGLADRITTVHADVAADAPPLGSADLIWSCAALHEVSDPVLALHNLFEALLPGGLLILLEMDAPPYVLPPRLMTFEERVRSAGGSFPATDHPDWTNAIGGAGFVRIRSQQLTTDQTLPAGGPAGEYAALELRRVGHQAMPSLDDSDRATLLALAGHGPGNVRTLDQLWVRGTRTLWAARRP